MNYMILFVLCALFFSHPIFSQQFSDQVEIASTTRLPKSMKTSDLDLDGDLDFIYISNHVKEISWSENLGNGEFATQQLITFCYNPIAATTGDVDGDGDEDVLWSTFNGGSEGYIVINENLGEADFEELEILIESSKIVYSIEAVDLDLDGDLDIVTGNTGVDGTSYIMWYENLGYATFGEEQTIYSLDAGLEPKNFCWSDFDGDDDIDIAFTVKSPQRLIVLENQGDLNYFSHELLNFSNDLDMSLSINDLNFDGFQDFIVTYDFNNLAYMLNLGNGEFDDPTIIDDSYSYVGNNYCADLNNDGQLDVVVTREVFGRVVWYNNILDSINSPQIILSQQFNVPTFIDVFDFENDGDLDITYGSYGGNCIKGFINLGGGEFETEKPLIDNLDYPTAEFAADVDGDDDLDVLVCSYGDNEVVWYPNNGDNTFGKVNEIHLNETSMRDIIAFDIESDGDMDVIASSGYDENSKILLFKNNGSAEFNAAETITSEVVDPNVLNFADLDQDNNIDLISASRGDNKLAWYKNNGDGSFGDQQIISDVELYINSVDLGDIDLDGDIDIATANISGNNVKIFVNDGNGNFSEQETFSFLENANSARLFDINNDQVLDIIYINDFSTLSYRINYGASGFGEQLNLIIEGGYLKKTCPLDVDNDDDLDIVLMYNDRLAWIENYNGSSFSLEKNLCDISFNDNQIANESLSSLDINNDGFTDVVAVSALHKVYWNQNIGNQGCTDPSACNYNEVAQEDNGTCCYDNCGCTDQNAINYNELAICDNGSCDYRIQGSVFHDLNENGIQDADEYGLALQEVIASNGETAFTNDLGIFYIDVGENETSVSITLPEEFPYPTRQNPQVFEEGINQMYMDNSLDFGLSSSLPDFELEANIYATGNEYLCDDFNLHNICFRNMGNLPIDGIVELTIDSLFQGNQELTPIDSVNGNTIFMSYSNLLPGQMFCYDILLQTPTVDHIGSFINTSVVVYGYFEGDQTAFGESSSVIELTCSFDPNDKLVLPAGYSEMHYIENDTLLEYLIRFQNTGNAPAQNIHILDVIDDNLDLSSFQLVANSHSVAVTIHPESREIDFFFEDIQLPDSVNNEPESHGLLSFKIRPEVDLPLLTEINNTANIFFDNNPPIVTNTTWSTTYNCSLFDVNFTDEGGILTASDGDSFQWFLNDEPIPGAVLQQYLVSEIGNYSVQINSNFPCSGMSESMYIVTIGIDELVRDQLVFFPNPFSEFAQINLGNLRGNYTIQIIDNKGSIVRSEEVILNENNRNIYTLKRNNMTSGSYVFTMFNGKEKFEVKFVVK